MDYFSDLEFVCFGSSKHATGVTKDRSFDYYGLQYIRAGEIYVQCGDHPAWQAEGPLLFLTGPGKKFAYHTPCGGREHIYVCFRGERVSRYLAGGLMPEPGQKILITEEKEFTSLMEEIVRKLQKNSRTGFGEAVLLLEKALLLSGNQPAPRQAGAFNRKIITDFAEKIAEHPEKEWNIEEAAAENRLSEVHFRRLFRRETGCSLNQYILQQRIRYATHLLQTTDMLIKEIAFSCGFGGEFYFSRQFSKFMKQSPSEFRKNI
ncbi:MAG: helix-turn-helix domain-containing protein [Lentisphaerae bacterium]|nr:helix-turn-helix domain-containing protein [Lentisphaerota bacterium]